MNTQKSQTLIEQYLKISSLSANDEDFIVFSDEEYAKYQEIIQYMVLNGYLNDAGIDNCNAFFKTAMFPYFQKQVLENDALNKAETEINIYGNISNANFAGSNGMQQSTRVNSDKKPWIEKYIVPIVVPIAVALITVVGSIIVALIQ